MKTAYGLALTALALLLAAAPQLGCTDSAAEGAIGAAAPSSAPPQARVRVRTAPVRHARLAMSDRASGTLRAFHKATVTAETSGRVVKRSVERGRSVQEGDILIELDASRLELDLRQAEATLRARLNDLEHARREHARGEQLVAESAISEQRRDDLRHALDAARDGHALALVARDAARRMLADTRITAPFAGTVDDLHVDVGDFVAAGTPVAELLDLSRARVFVGVTATEAGRLRAGAPATATFAALGGLAQQAELKSVGRAADPRDGTYQVELWIADPDPRLRDGMVASIELADDDGGEQALAPRAALLRRSGRSEVFVVDRESGGAQGLARSRVVRTGRSSGDWVEILDGLAEGEEVVVEGHFALRDGSAVAIEGAVDAAN